MPVTVACPSCKAKLKAPDALIGKVVRCPGCGNPVQVVVVPNLELKPEPRLAPNPAVSSKSATPPKKKPEPEPLEELEEVEDDIVEDVEVVEDVAEVEEVQEAVTDERPRSKRRREEIEAEDDRPRKRRRDDDEDDYDDRPRKRRRDEDDYDDEDDDRPRGKKRKRGSRKSEDQTMAMLCHLLALFTSFVGPLVIWLMKKQDSKFIDHHGRQALNFVFTMMIYSFSIAALGFGMMCLLGLVLPILGFILWLFVLLALSGLGLYSLIFTIIGCVKAKSGEWYTYPGAIRFLG
jgi:uncharacterized Tic20 family protein